MDPHSLLVGLTLVCGVLGTLGLLVSLMILEWPTRKAANNGEAIKLLIGKRG